MNIENPEFSRRTLVKGAAWSLPVIAVAAATPLASASTTNATAAWNATQTQLFSLEFLNGTGPVPASRFPTAPTEFRIVNGGGVIPNVTAAFSVRQETSMLDFAISGGERFMTGFGPATIAGGTKVGSTAVAGRKVEGSQIKADLYAQDTTSVFSLGDIPDGERVNFTITTWGAVPRRGLGVSISTSAAFTVTVSLQSNGVEFATLSRAEVTVPLNAGLL